MTPRSRCASPRRVRRRGVRLQSTPTTTTTAPSCLRCDAAARSRRRVETFRVTPDPETDLWLAGPSSDPSLDDNSERGGETTRGTTGRGQLSVEARRTASALDDSLAHDTHAQPGGNMPALAAVIGPAMPTANATAIGGSAAMSLQTFDPTTPKPGAVPSAASMRVMETGLAFVAILVALLLNLGR